MSEFSDNLYELRKSRKLSQEELAEKLSVSRQTISKWESGVTTPDMDKLRLICEIFSVGVNELMGSIQERETSNNIEKAFVSDLDDGKKAAKNSGKVLIAEKPKPVKVLLYLIAFIFLGLALIYIAIGLSDHTLLYIAGICLPFGLFFLYWGYTQRTTRKLKLWIATIIAIVLSLAIGLGFSTAFPYESPIKDNNSQVEENDSEKQAILDDKTGEDIVNAYSKTSDKSPQEELSEENPSKADNSVLDEEIKESPIVNDSNSDGDEYQDIEVSFERQNIKEGKKELVKVYVNNRSSRKFSGNVYIAFYSTVGSKSLGSDTLIVDELLPGGQTWANVYIKEYDGTIKSAVNIYDAAFEDITVGFDDYDVKRTEEILTEYKESFGASYGYPATEWFENVKDLKAYDDGSVVITLEPSTDNDVLICSAILFLDDSIKSVTAIDKTGKVLSVRER